MEVGRWKLEDGSWKMEVGMALFGHRIYEYTQVDSLYTPPPPHLSNWSIQQTPLVYTHHPQYKP